jgi:TMEM175 potassium channel family protein
VFAFAITLMALTVHIPDLSPSLTEPQLVDKLLDMTPQIESYILSFFIISIFWLSYHQVFNQIRDSYISMVYLNLVFLLLITLLSISTSLVITFESYQISYLVYYSVVVATSSLLVVIWWYAMRIKATDEKLHPLFKRGLLTQLMVIPVVFVMSIAITFVNLNIAQYFWVTIIPISIYCRRKFRH